MRTARAHAPATVLVIAAAYIAYRFGGGAEARAREHAHERAAQTTTTAVATPSPTPLKAGGSAPSGTGASTNEAYEARFHFVETVGEARYDVPRAQAGLVALRAHWRKMDVPWVALPPDAVAHVTSIALRTSATETQWAMPTSKGTTWAPDARVWNMNEGSYDQREALVAPAPATISYKLAIPPQAKLTFAPGVVSAHGATVFSVVVTDAGGSPHVVFTKRVTADEAQQWFDGSADLGPFAGQTVDVAFKTESDDVTASGPVALGVWGNPTLLAKGATAAPYNVLWIVVDALRPDVVASFHDDAEDAAKLHAHRAPLEALLPKVPGLTPVIDDLTTKGVRFTHAYSAGSWTRPGTLAMLGGARSSELGVETLPWMLSEPSRTRYYGSSPPLLPLLLRKAGVVTRAFVNNYFMVGYAPVGIDLGFERVDDHRYRTRDTLEITRSAVAFLKAHGDERFFAFCNFNSPHEPWEPPAAMQARVPPPPKGPADDITRRYMGEAGKDDEAIGILLAALGETGARDHTLVVVTADHGETLSSAHAGVSKLDTMKVRYHHAVSNYEETTRIPIVLSLPHVLDNGSAVTPRVRNTDLAPTVLALMGIEPPARMSGRSLLGLARGEKEADARVVVSEGRGTRGIIAGKYRLLVRDGAARTTTVDDKVVTVAEELYDLDDDPGERNDLAHSHPELVAEMRARLEAALKNVPAADSHAARAPLASASNAATLRLRFAGGGAAHRISGSLVTSSSHGAPLLKITGVGIDASAFTHDGPTVDVALTTAADAIVGFDVEVDPAGSDVRWKLFLDDAPWPAGRVFVGPFGLASASTVSGIASDEARAEAFAPRIADISPTRDFGLFVTRDRRDGGGSAGERGGDSAHGASPEATREMQRLLQEWGYAHGSGGAKK